MITVYKTSVKAHNTIDEDRHQYASDSFENVRISHYTGHTL